MAIVGDFYTIDGVEQVAREGEKAFNVLLNCNNTDLSNLVDNTIAHLQTRITELEGLENDFKIAFNCSSLEEFAQRVERYYHFGSLTSFTGSQLQPIVNQYRKMIEADKKILNKNAKLLFEQTLAPLKTSFAQEIEAMLRGEAVKNELIEEAMALFEQELNSVGSKNLKVVGGRHFQKVSQGEGKSVLKLVATKGTEAFRKRVINVLKTKFGNKIKYNAEIDYTNTSVKEQFTIDYMNIIRMDPNDPNSKLLTGTAAEKNLSNEEIIKRNGEIKTLLCNYLNLSGEYKTYFENRLDYMLGIDPTMFFVGKSFTGLEGILGEINSVMAITDLLGPQYTAKALQWIGSQSGGNSKKQPSIDIVVDNLVDNGTKIQFGFQIKNTIEELGIDVSHYVSFANKNVSEIVARMMGNSGVSPDAIESVYYADTFNVPYKREGRRYIQVGYNTVFEHHDFITKALFDDYIYIDKLIDNIVENINLYLTRFAPNLMYMQFDTTGDSFKGALAQLDHQLINKSTTGNFCYIVGSKVFFANRMLADLKKQLEALQEAKIQAQQLDIQFETYFEKRGGRESKFNIVYAMNGAHAKDYTLKMRTSWGFHQ